MVALPWDLVSHKFILTRPQVDKYFHYGSPTMGFSITQFYIDKIPSIIRITDKYFHHGSPTMGFSITQFYIDKITSIIRMISHSTFCRTWGDIGASCQFYQLKAETGCFSGVWGPNAAYKNNCGKNWPTPTLPNLTHFPFFPKFPKGSPLGKM